MHQRAVLLHPRRLQGNAVIAGAERALAGIEDDVEVVGTRRCEREDKLDARSAAERLVAFRPDRDRQICVLVARDGTAVLHVEVQYQRVAPLSRSRERCTDLGDRVVDDGVDVALRRARAFDGLDVEILRKRDCLLESRRHGGIPGPQSRGRVAGRLRYRCDRYAQPGGGDRRSNDLAQPASTRPDIDGDWLDSPGHYRAPDAAARRPASSVTGSSRPR